MAKDLMHAIAEAETTIAARMEARKKLGQEQRTVLAAEAIADEMTRLHAEVRTLRYLFASTAPVPRR